MIVGFSKHGKGRAQGVLDYLMSENCASGALDYLLGDKNRAGVRRSPMPVVLRGDPGATRDLINTSTFAWRYTSGVLSFSAGERITPEMEKQIMDEFEAIAFAGLSRDRYHILWIRHAHTGREEMHFVVPRMELATGKSLNIAPPGRASRQLFDTFRSKINAQFGLSDPDDPARRRALSLPSVLAKLQKQPNASWAVRNTRIRQALNDCIAAKVGTGAIRNRDQVIHELKAAGFQVTRQGKDYLTIRQPITGERFRLRGKCYRHDWTGNIGRTLRLREPDLQRAGDFARKLTRQCQTRAEFNLKRYGLPPLVNPSPTLNHDRTGNTPSERAQTLGGTIPRARSAICQHAGRFEQAVERWRRADCDLEHAIIRFGAANRAFATSFEPTLAVVDQRQAPPLPNHRYSRARGALGTETRAAVLHDRSPGLEPEMEVEFP